MNTGRRTAGKPYEGYSINAGEVPVVTAQTKIAAVAMSDVLWSKALGPTASTGWALGRVGQWLCF